MKRYGLLDGIRGITIISMILYHMVWDRVYLFGAEPGWYGTWIAYIWQQSICWTFVLLSGFCFPLGRRKLRRGIIVSVMGLAIMAGTCMVTPDSRVVFGVLTLLGSCMLLMLPVDYILRGRKPLIGLGISLLFFFLFRNVNSGYLGFEEIRLMPLPKMLYQNLGTAYMGFPPSEFFSSDYFSLIPWMFLFLSGYYLHYLMKEGEHMAVLEKEGIGWLAWIGRHSLIIYMLHQPVLVAVLSLLL